MEHMSAIALQEASSTRYSAPAHYVPGWITLSETPYPYKEIMSLIL